MGNQLCKSKVFGCDDEVLTPDDVKSFVNCAVKFLNSECGYDECMLKGLTIFSPILESAKAAIEANQGLFYNAHLDGDLEAEIKMQADDGLDTSINGMISTAMNINSEGPGWYAFEGPAVNQKNNSALAIVVSFLVSASGLTVDSAGLAINKTSLIQTFANNAYADEGVRVSEAVKLQSALNDILFPHDVNALESDEFLYIQDEGQLIRGKVVNLLEAKLCKKNIKAKSYEADGCRPLCLPPGLYISDNCSCGSSLSSRGDDGCGCDRREYNTPLFAGREGIKYLLTKNFL